MFLLEILADYVVDQGRREAAIDSLGLPPEDPADPYAASTETFVQLARSRSAETIPAPSGVDFLPDDPDEDLPAEDVQTLPLRWPPPYTKEVAF